MQQILFWIFTSSILFLGYFSYDVAMMQGFNDTTIEEPSADMIIKEGDAYLSEVKELIGDPLEFTSGSHTKAGTGMQQNRSALIQESTIVTYEVDGDTLFNEVVNSANTEQTEYAKDTFQHNELWKSFTTIIPAELRTNVKSFSIFSDGTSNLLGYVDSLDYNGDHW